MNRYPSPGRAQRTVSAVVALLASLVTFGSVAGLAQGYADAAQTAQELVMASVAAAVH
ncbi:MAG TPA: hypothetical protein VMU47_20725 [Caldimonas sp.]|nr:hypothetical protein [Caldimonas sp.]